MKNFRFIVLLFFISSGYLSAQVEFTGYGSTGFRWYERNPLKSYNQEVYYEGKLQAELEFNDDIEAQLDLRGNSEENRVTFREFSVKFEYWDNIRFKLGNIRQTFGLEQIISRDEYYFVERSEVNDEFSDLGYAQRAVSLMMYGEYDDDDEDELPYSYYVSVYKNNSLAFGTTARFTRHFGDFSVSGNHGFISIGGEYPISSHAVAADLSYNKKDFNASIEFFYGGNTIEILRRRSVNVNTNAYAVGTKLVAAIRFDTGGKIIKKIEPIFLGGYYAPNSDYTDEHQLQAVPGINFYFDKDVRFRLNGILLAKRNRFLNEYTYKESSFVAEIQVRF